MLAEDSTLVQTPPHTYADRAAVPRAAPIVVPWPWQRLALGAILVVAAVLNFWQLSQVGYGNTYYAAAVRSMLQNWHAFLFNAFDVNGFVTIDKPPLGFWLQVASAKLFGFSGLSLMLPQALAGVLSVAVLYRLVSRTFGAGAGLLAALALAVMPVSVAANRSNIVDSTLVLVTLLGAWAVLRAAETGRLRWLLLCAVLVGLGFNVKMLQAYLVVPAFGLLYLLAAPRRWTTRVWHLAVATVALLAISLSWVTAVDLTPASQRPYVGSSTHNSALELALGYNGLQRLTGNVFGRGPRPSRPDGTTTARSEGTPNPAGSGGANGGFTRGESGNPGPLRLVNSALGGQASWLLALALLGMIAAAWRRLPRFPLDRREQSLVLWGMWLLTMGAFFSIAGFFHAYYLVMLAPAIAALAGIGLVALWHDYRRPGWRGWALPAALLATAAVQAAMLSAYPDWSRWLTPLVVGATLVAAGTLVLGRLSQRWGRHVAVGAAALGVVALLAAPTAWAAATVANGDGGLTPSAGPRAQDAGFPGGAGGPFGPGAPSSLQARERNGFPAPGNPGGFGGPEGFGNDRGGFGGRFGGRRGGAGGVDGGVNQTLLHYLEVHQGTTRYLFATSNANSASGYIIQTGKPVMALGGFLGSDPILTPTTLAQLVANGTVRYFLLPSAQGFRMPSGMLQDVPSSVRNQIEAFGRGGSGGFGPGGQASALTQWVSTNCATVPSSLWQTTSSNQSGASAGGPGFGPDNGGQQLYDCASRPSK